MQVPILRHLKKKLGVNLLKLGTKRTSIEEICQRLFGLTKQNGNVPQYLTGKVNLHGKEINEKTNSYFSKTP